MESTSKKGGVKILRAQELTFVVKVGNRSAERSLERVKIGQLRRLRLVIENHSKGGISIYKLCSIQLALRGERAGGADEDDCDKVL